MYTNDSEFKPLPAEQASLLEQALQPMTATTKFYGMLGTNIVWGFTLKEGKPGVAIASTVSRSGEKCGQVVVNIDNLRELLKLMES